GMMRIVAGVSLGRFRAALEQFQRGQRTHDLAFGFVAEDLNGLFETELRVRRDGDREPQIEIIVAPVVLRYPRMRIDRLRGVINAIGIDLRRHETGTISERARIELRTELPNDSFSLQAL